MNHATPLFVYGTLRPGCGLHDRIAPAVLRHEPARAAGLLFYHGCRLYPVYFAMPADEVPFTVCGDVLYVKDWRDEFVDVVRMELLAGYDARWLEVHLLNGRKLTALTFTYTPGANESLDPIPGNDWLNAEPADGIH